MMRRLFIAINLPTDIVRRIDAEAAELERLFRDESNGAQAPVRMLAPAAWHITVTFLGEHDDEAVGEIVGALRETADSYAAPRIRLTELIYGPPRHPAKMIWLGADRETTRRLSDIKAALDDALQGRRVAREETMRRFEGHITLARFVGHVRRMPPLALAAPLEFTAESLDLMESELGREGPAYTLLTAMPFRIEEE